MTMLFEISSRCRKVLGRRIAKGELFQGMGYPAVVVNHMVASVTLWNLSPFDQLVPISALSDLAVANPVNSINGWHWRIVSCAHYVLTYGVQTMEIVVSWHHFW